MSWSNEAELLEKQRVGKEAPTQQAPVAWMNDIAYAETRAELPDNHGEEIPLYTHPVPAMKPLSDDEIRTIDSDLCGERLTADGWIIKFARSVEQALKEKNM